MKKLLLFSFAAAALTFASCKKEKSTQPGTTPTPAGKTLVKITKTEGTAVTVYNLQYDGAHRLTSVKTADNSEFTNFTYDANGNVTKTEETANGFKNIYTYTYANGAPVSGAFKSWLLHPGEPDELIEDDLLTYTLTNNQVSRIHLNMQQTAEEMDLDLTYANGNLTKVVSAPGSTIPFTATFTFGTHRPAFPKVYKWVLDQAGFSLQFGSNNEMQRQVVEFPGTGISTTTNMQYTFDAAGYVLTSNDGDASYKFDYQ